MYSQPPPPLKWHESLNHSAVHSASQHMKSFLPEKEQFWRKKNRYQKFKFMSRSTHSKICFLIHVISLNALIPFHFEGIWKDETYLLHCLKKQSF